MNSSTGKMAEKGKYRNSGYHEDLEQLRQSFLFQGLSPDCLKLLVMVCKGIDFVKDDLLMTQGEDDGFAYIITSGQVSAMFSDGAGNNLIRRYTSGDFIGGCALLGRMTRVFTLKAEDKTSALRLSRDDFQKVMEKYPDDIAKVTGSLISELAQWDRTLLERQITDEGLVPRSLGVSLL